MTKPTQKKKSLKGVLKGKVSSVSERKSGKTVIISATVKRKTIQKSTGYQDYLLESLRDPEEAAGYLNAALVGGDIKVFLLALQNVVQAQGGVSALSKRTKKSRTSLYKTLSEKGNPYLKNANELLNTMGMHLAIVPDKQRSSITQPLNR